MNIAGKIGGVEVELNKPDIMLQDGKWWEAVEYRKAKRGEYMYGAISKACIESAFDNKQDLDWIMSPIPTPTQAQLDAIGKVTGKVPTECKNGDVIWDGLHFHRAWSNWKDEHIGKFRFVLEDAPGVKETCPKCKGGKWLGIWLCDCQKPTRSKPPAPPPTHICLGCTTPAILCPMGNDPKDNVKECASKNLKWPMKNGVGDGGPQDKGKVHTSCAGCSMGGYNPYKVCCITCSPWDGSREWRKNWTPEQPAPEPKDSLDTSAAWNYVWNLCRELGFTVSGHGEISDILAFIRSLAEKAPQPAPGAFTVEEIVEWFKNVHLA